MNDLSPRERTLLANWFRVKHLPPLGWTVNISRERFIPDPVYFPLMRRIWDLVLGETPVDEVRRIVNEDWGFRTPMRGRTGGKPLANGVLYKMLRDPFYCGRICWRGTQEPGEHVPMVTSDEFQRVQELLDRRRKNDSCRRIASEVA